jgi:hypothetical protein
MAQASVRQRSARPASDLSSVQCFAAHTWTWLTSERSITMTMPSGLSVRIKMVNMYHGRREWREN